MLWGDATAEYKQRIHIVVGFYSAGLIRFVHAFFFLQHHRQFILIFDMF